MKLKLVLQKASTSSQRIPQEIRRNPQNKYFQSASTNTDKFLNKVMKIHPKILQFISIITANLRNKLNNKRNFFKKDERMKKRSL